MLDTNVEFEWSKHTPDPSALRFRANLDQSRAYVGAITVGELEYGLARLPAGNRKTGLVQWLRRFEVSWLDRVLPIDLEIAQVWADVVARMQSEGHNIQPSDSWIAATAIRHGMTLAT